jgi:crotonobetainyl-CoA:carnitine CoA-transferase CaiB-like acyl-CoA transferase
MALALFVAMGRDELIRDPRFASNLARVENENELRSQVQSWVATMTRDETLALLDRHKVVCGPVNTAEDIVRDPHFLFRTLVSGDDPVLGRVTVPGRPAQLAGSPQVPFASSPNLGEHTEQGLKEWAGIDGEALAGLRREGVLGRNV